MVSFEIRDARKEDASAIARIYEHYVRTSSCTFEELAPTEDEMAGRMAQIKDAGFPCLVAQRPNTDVIGYAYASPFRPRWGYRYSVENSVYVAAEHVGQGIGTALMRDLIGICTSLGYRQMIAVIGDRANEASIRLHRRLGFKLAGELVAVGLKFGRWIDVIDMQLPLGEGGRSIPAANPANMI